MNDEEKEVIKKLLKLYPDVIKDLGGESIVSNEGQIEHIGSYIKNHKWFVNEGLPFTVNMDEAFFSWHENVYVPQINAMKETNIASILSKYSKFEIFQIVSDEYYYLKEKDKEAYYDKACYAVIKREAKSFIKRFSAGLKLK